MAVMKDRNYKETHSNTTLLSAQYIKNPTGFVFNACNLSTLMSHKSHNIKSFSSIIPFYL